MNGYLWAVVIAVASLPVLVFLFFAYFRTKKPHSRRKEEEKEQLNKKQHAKDVTVPKLQEKSRGDKRIAWFIIAIVIGLGLWWWFTKKPSTWWSWSDLSPSPEGVWSLVKDHWFWVIIVVSVLYFFFGSIARPWAKASKSVVAMVVATLLGALVVYWIWGEKKPDSADYSSSQISQIACQPVSEDVVHRCVIGEDPVVFTTEKLQYSRYLEFCVVKPADGEYKWRQVMSTTWLIWSTKGPLPIEYKLVEGSCLDKFS